MSLLTLALWAAGGALIVVGSVRGRGPWARYQSLKQQDANVARYEAWRGGLRDDGPTGASVAMAMLRRQVLEAVVITVVGAILVIAGFAVPNG